MLYGKIYLKKFQFKNWKKNLKFTHQEFNKKIYLLLKSKNISNFLRENFIQKMFFLHNRYFVFKELKELRRDKNGFFMKN